MKRYFILILFLFVLFGCKELRTYGQIRLINMAQQAPDSKLLKNNFATWEKDLPFDGLCIGFNSNKINHKNSLGYFGRGDDELGYSVFKNNKILEYRNYSNAINDVKNTKFRKFKHNFLTIAVFNVNWTTWVDDKSWNSMILNLETASKIAYDSGLKGIILDTETYGSPQNLNLVFYCQQFIQKLYLRNSRIAYVRIKDCKDNNSIDDLFPKTNSKIYWKDVNDVASGIRLKKVYLDIYVDDNGNYYYPLLDSKYKEEIKNIVRKVEYRGKQIIEAIDRNFPSAEIVLTVGPSYIKDVLSTINGLNASNNPLRTLSGLLVPLTRGMLLKANDSNIKLIDGQEQAYYFKSKQQFERSQANFMASANYFDSSIKSIFLNKMKKAVGLYIRPTSLKTNSNERIFTQNEVINSVRHVFGQKDIEFIWFYEEKESYWYLPSLRDRYLSNGKDMKKIGGNDFYKFIDNIKLGTEK